MQFALIALPFLLAGLVPVLATWISAKWISRLIAGSLLILFIWVCTLLPTLHEQGVIVLSYPWVTQFNLSLELYFDGLSAIFTLLITGIGAGVFLYAGYYMEGDPRTPRFLALLSAFTGSMLGVVLSGNLLELFICWELTSVFSYLLIGFDGKNPDARSAATQALVVTGGGGLALLVGLILLSLASGSASFTDVLHFRMQDHPWYAGVTVLILLGCFTKSAQFPFHFWLPGGMTAPTPASAFLHSATMVKAGIYLLARLYPTLGDTNLWLVALAGVGLLTMLVGSTIALRQRDLKGLLAYATVSWLGALVLMLGLPHHEGYVAALVGIIGHALYKSPLFMVAGAIDHTTGTRIIDKLGGLARAMPGALAITLVCCLSMAGVIPLLGFAAKEALLHAVTELHEPAAPLILIGVCVAAALTVTVAAIFLWDVFFKKPHPHAEEHHDNHAHAHHAAPLMLLGPGIIAAVSVVLALLIEPVLVPLLELAAPPDAHVDLHLFPGFTPIFFLSLGLIAVGIVVFLLRRWWLGLNMTSPSSGRRVYMGFIQALNNAGDALLKIQSGKLSQYLVLILGVIGVILILPASQYLSSVPTDLSPLTSTNFMEGALLLLTIASIVGSILFKGHLLATLALGVAGYAVGGIFLLAPGPDIAMVQILVETLAAVLVIIMLSRISERKRRRAAETIWGGGRRTIRRDILVSVLVGVGVGSFALAAVVNRPSRDSIIADYYLETAESEVGVKDVVGAIVTDFRGTDTLFEITVFSMAAGGVLTILFISTHASQREKPPTAPITASLSQIATPLTQLAAKLLLPIAMIIALAHLLYAGDAPGDGFTAGVIGGISIALWYQVFGYDSARLRRLHVEFLIGIGVALAAANALLPLLFGESFLQHYSILDIPLPGGLHFNSSTVFEIAIFLTVFGSIVTMINAMTRPEGIEQL